MAIAIDATTPALVSGSTSCTTASFTAPVDSLLVALCSAGGGSSTLTVTNNGTALTWTTNVFHMISTDTGAFGATALIATAPAPISTARTVTFTSNAGGSPVAMKLLVITGADIAGVPVGAVGENHSTTPNITPNVYTSTVDNSRAVGIGADNTGSTTPTSSDTGFAYSAGGVSGIAVYKAADTTPAGSVVTLNFNGGAIARQWNWAAAEILPFVPPYIPPRPLTPGMSAPIFRGAYY